MLLAAASSVQCPKAKLCMYVCLTNIPVDIRQNFVASTHWSVMDSAHSIFFISVFSWRWVQWGLASTDQPAPHVWCFTPHEDSTVTLWLQPECCRGLHGNTWVSCWKALCVGCLESYAHVAMHLFGLVLVAYMKHFCMMLSLCTFHIIAVIADATISLIPPTAPTILVYFLH